MTWAIVAANVAVAAVGLLPGGPGELRLQEDLGQSRLAVWDGEPWRLVTGTFVHAGAAHLIVNLFAFVLLGRILERALGHLRFALLYLVSGLTGALFFQVWSAGDLGLGASGAVYGTFGFFLAVRSAALRGRRGGGVAGFVLWTVGVFAADQLMALTAFAISGVRMAFSAHLGGFLGGALLAPPWLSRTVPSLRVPRLAASGAAVALSLTVVGLGVRAFGYPPSGIDLRAARGWSELEERVAAGDYARAIELWRKVPADEPVHCLTRGYALFEELMALGRPELARPLVEEVAARGLEIVRSRLAGGPVAPDLLNTVAWACAMAGKDLGEARHLADAAVRSSERLLDRGPFGLFAPSGEKERLGMYLNTRAWVDFRRWGESGEGDPRTAIRDLEKAARLFPIGGNYLFLAWAYYGVAEVADAREALRRARRAGHLTPYEAVLAEELEGNL